MVSDVSPTVVGGFDRNGRWWVIAIFSALGAGVGALLPYVVGWAADLPWVPFQGPMELLASFDQTWLAWGRPLIGMALGLAFAGWTIADSPVLEIETACVRVRRRGEVQRVLNRSKIDAVHRKGNAVVIENAQVVTHFQDH
ncbi:MAG TPA: hypothetical protein PLQ19_11455 [Aeromicrobium sp.]|nr:hypothetical protein [Aeromicrobium sp.]